MRLFYTALILMLAGITIITISTNLPLYLLGYTITTAPYILMLLNKIKTPKQGLKNFIPLILAYHILPILNEGTVLSTDITQYAKQALPILKGLIPYRDFPVAYPPISIYAMVPFVALNDPRFIKIPFVLCNLATIYLVYRKFWSPDNPDTPNLPILFALFPLTIIEYSFSGHNDSLPILFLLLSTYFLKRGTLRSGILTGLATMCKLFPALSVPFFAKHLWSENKKETIIYAGGFAVTCILTSAPFLLLAHEGYVATILGHTRYPAPYGVIPLIILGILGNEPANYQLAEALTLLIAGLVVVSLFLFYQRQENSVMKTIAILLLTLPFIIQQIHPWYLLWALPFMLIAYTKNAKIITPYLLVLLAAHPFWLYAHASYVTS